MATGRRHEWLMSTEEFDVLWRELDLGEPAYPLELPSPGTTFEERAEIVQETWAELAARGIVNANNRQPPPELAEAITLLATGELTIDGLIKIGDGGRVLAARTGTMAAMAVQHGADELTLSTFDGAVLSAMVGDLLPPQPAAPGQSVRLPRQALSGALERLAAGDAGLWEFEQTLRDAGLNGRDVRWVAAMTQGDQGYGAQFGVNLGKQRLGVLSWYATEHGAVILSQQDDWLTIAPGDPARLVGRIDDLVADARW